MNMQGTESDHFRVKQNMPKVGCFQSFRTARKTIKDFETLLWLKNGFGFIGPWTIEKQNMLIVSCFGRKMVNKA